MDAPGMYDEPDYGLDFEDRTLWDEEFYDVLRMTAEQEWAEQMVEATDKAEALGHEISPDMTLYQIQALPGMEHVQHLDPDQIRTMMEND
jgi:hypothetical protein